MQILESGNIRSKIISKYDLLNHYEIDVTGKYVNTDLNKPIMKISALKEIIMVRSSLL